MLNTDEIKFRAAVMQRLSQMQDQLSAIVAQHQLWMTREQEWNERRDASLRQLEADRREFIDSINRCFDDEREGEWWKDGDCPPY